MIFVGDIAVPRGITSIATCSRPDWGQRSVIANLEGAILSDNESDTGTRLYNDKSVLSYLHAMNIRLVTLANNHVTDLHPSPRATIDLLSANNILACGAGESIEDASSPVLLQDIDGETVFIGFGWNVIGCRIASATTPGVNPLTPEAVINGIRLANKRYPQTRIVLLMHWNYELEMYPQPMHRQLAHRAIEYGASAVIGCHSHCVQGIEVYQGAPIVYGLGNWFLPEGTGFGRFIRFPDFALRQLAFDWNPCSGDMHCHWFSYNRYSHALEYDKSERACDSTAVRLLTPFVSMSHAEYVRWFRMNRRKRILLPVYRNIDHGTRNKLRDGWVRARQGLIGIGVALKIKRTLR